MAKHIILGEGNVIIYISDTIGYQENGNVLVDNGTLAIAQMLVTEVIEMETIPDYVTTQDYLYVNGEFVENPNCPPERTLDGMKSTKVAESKTALATYLASHPMTGTDGKQYSVTQEKQSLLTSQLALYSVSVSAGGTYTLRWNSTGEECTEWAYADLAALALAIGAYVQPFVSKQQELEVLIKACASKAELKAIIIDYGSGLTT